MNITTDEDKKPYIAISECWTDAGAMLTALDVGIRWLDAGETAKAREAMAYVYLPILQRKEDVADKIWNIRATLHVDAQGIITYYNEYIATEIVGEVENYVGHARPFGVKDVPLLVEYDLLGEEAGESGLIEAVPDK